MSSLPPGFEGFNLGPTSNQYVRETKEQDPKLTVYQTLKRDDVFTLGGKVEWKVIKVLGDFIFWVVKTSQSQRRRKDFVMIRDHRDLRRSQVFLATGGGLDPVGPVIDEGFIKIKKLELKKVSEK